MSFPQPSGKKGRRPSPLAERRRGAYTAVVRRGGDQSLGSVRKKGRVWRKSGEDYWLAGLVGGVAAQIIGGIWTFVFCLWPRWLLGCPGWVRFSLRVFWKLAD